MSESGLRFVALAAGLVLYGLLGSPTPDHPGATEFFVGLCMVVAVGPFHALALLRPQARFPWFWQRAGQVLLWYGLTVPVVAGIVGDNDPGQMLRDFLPFLFMMMPVLLFRLVTIDSNGERILLALALWIGLAFSVRSFFHGGEFVPASVLLMPVSAELLYLANAPTVLFAAVFLGGYGLQRLAGFPTVTRLVSGSLCICLAAFPAIAMALVLQRASIGYLGIALAFLLLWIVVRAPRFAVIPLVVAGLAAGWFAPQLAGLIGVLAEKTLAVGLNNRVEEAVAVVRALDGNVFAIAFGNGWGATFASPAVGDQTVNFTHNLLTAFWLKSGVVGVMLALTYVGAISVRVCRVAVGNPLIGLALAGPLIIAVVLYASYKSVDFGLLLLLGVAASAQRRTLHGGDEWCNENIAPMFDYSRQETTGHAVKGPQ